MSENLQALIPYVKPIEALLLDPSVSDVLVNGDGSIHYERAGVLTVYAHCYPSGELTHAVRRIARSMGRDVDEKQPLFEGRLGDGSRVAIVIPPCSVGGTTLAIRKFVYRPLGVDQLMESGMITSRQADMFGDAVRDHKTILICGQTGAGKTTLLNTLTAFIPREERVIAIEEVNELRLNRGNVVYLESRPADGNMPEVTISELLRKTLRLRPDRIIVGEVRGKEAFDMLQALNTGHRGSLATIHANDCPSALMRLRTCVAMAGIDLAPSTFAEMIAGAIDMVVQVERVKGKRVVSSMMRVEGYDNGTDRYRLSEELA
jgi:pilus assembly protein CpaF